MSYHFLDAIYGSFSANSFWGRISIYGVSIFYILSGITLHNVYLIKMKPTFNESISFFRKRFLRIFPLFWLVTIFTIILSKKYPDILILLLNLTGLFAFFRWNSYFATGAWSIGNEIVFYTIFPFLILLKNKKKILLNLVYLISFILYLFFSFITLKRNLSLSIQWEEYINPLNHVFLFISGFFITNYLNKIKISNFTLFIILTCTILLFIFYPVKGNVIELVIGANRLLFTLLSILICFCFYKINFSSHVIIHKIFNLLGESSYSIYLLHPIVYIIFKRLNNYYLHFSNSLFLTTCIFFTILISYFTYLYFEKFFISLGTINKKII